MNRFFAIMYVLGCLSLQAQVPLAQLHSTQDLGNLRLTTVYQDIHGWLWLGGTNGVYRYDGQEFMPLKFPDTLKQAAVSILFESDGVLWAGFQNGAIACLPNSNSRIPIPNGDFAEDLKHAPQMVLWTPEEGTPQARISGFAKDAQGALWISTYGEGVYVWKNNRLYQFNAMDDGLAGDDIYAMVADNQGRIWAATDGGISICQMAVPGQKQVQNLTRANGLPDEIITALTLDNQGNMWGGTDEKGVFRFNASSQQVDVSSSSWSYGQVTNLVVFGQTEVWAGTEKYGMIRFDAMHGTTMHLPDEHDLCDTKIRSVCKNREGLMWVVADRGELYSAKMRYGFMATPFSNIQAICTDAKGRFWVGAQEGLYCQQAGKFVAVLPQKQNIVSLWVSPVDGVVWAGSLGNGVFLIHPDGRLLRHMPERETRVNGSVLSIAGNTERVWLATLGGLSVWNLKTLQPEHDVVQQALGENYLYKVLNDSKGRVWFGTDGSGLMVYENGQLTTHTSAAGVVLRTIYCLVEDRKGNIWFSTDRDGLFRYDGKTFKRYTTQNHLHSLEITGVAVDGNNQIFIGYEDGFDVLSQDRFDHVNFCGTKTCAPQVKVNLNAMWTDAQGHVWLGADGGLVRAAAFQEKILDDPLPEITGVSVFLQPIDFLRDTVFAYDQNSFLFNFIGLWYSNPESVRYRYILEGFDPEWKISKDHTASYPKLPPGKYRFRVQTSEHGNFTDVPETVWSFEIAAPFWQRWWFVLLATSGFAGLLIAVMRWRERQFNREATLKREKLASQFETLKSQINPHFLFNSFNTLITIIEENPKLAVSYVEHLSDFYRSIMVYRERDFITVAEEMELVHSFEFLLKKRYENGFHLHTQLNGLSGKVMPLSLQMLVENAVKHNVISGAKPLTVEIFTENNYIVVRNNIQRKIKPEISTHFGLQSLINRYKLLGEKPVVVEDNDAFFVVKIPIL